ncbi:hypothetical protein Vretimale_2459 [Volvox reticuliferus]|uniref:Uncharacterized protein n=1 Tax=Volvox reticuliferus TaxID=1737510 RepID=A0A8J4C557_9CHLO|nr:hypothetical protein Vretifemale_4752 [Volvox reticuliferus]GIL96695.1 hypothetical protein Vretimale_2459 [Volvox reticuliferus]
MRTGSTFELQIQGARTGIASKDESARSIGGSGTKRGAGVQLGSFERSAPQQQVSPYLNSLSYANHELIGGRRSGANNIATASPMGTGKSLAAGASAAVQEAHQRLERLLGPQQPATGAVKRPISAPLTFGTPISASTSGAGAGGNVSGASGAAAPYTSASPAATGSATSSRPRPASASSLQTSAAGTPPSSVSLLSTVPSSIAGSSPSAASNQRCASGRGMSTSESSSGMLASVGVTGVISSGHNSIAVSAGESVGATKGRLRSPTGGLSNTKEALGVADQCILGPGGVLLDGSASMPALLPSSLESSSSSGSGAASGRRRSNGTSAAALTTSSSEKVLGLSRLAVGSGGRNTGQSTLRIASPNSTSPKAGSGSGSGAPGPGLVLHGPTKSQSQSRRRLSSGDMAGSGGSAGILPASSVDGTGGRAGTAGTGTGATMLKMGQVVSTSRPGSAGGGNGSQSGQGQANRSGGSQASGDGTKVRTKTAGSDRQHMGPRSPASPSGTSVGVSGAKAVTGRSSVGTGSSGKAATPGSGTKVVSGRRASTGHQDTGGAATGLGGEFVLASNPTVRASSAATGGPGFSSSSNSGANGRPSSSERRRRSSSSLGTTTGSRSSAEATAAAAGSASGNGLSLGVLRDAAARQPSTSSPMSLTSMGGTALQGGTGSRIKPPSIDLSALTSGAAAASETTPVLNHHAVEPCKGVAGSGGGRRAAAVEFSGSLETRLCPPVSPTTTGPPGGAVRITGATGLDDSAAPPPLLLLPTRSPLQSPRSALGLPRRARGSLGSGGALTSSGSGLPGPCRWARNSPLPREACGGALGSEMPASTVAMHDLQVSAHNLLLQVGAGTSTFIETLRERYVEAYRASRKAH